MKILLSLIVTSFFSLTIIAQETDVKEASSTDKKFVREYSNLSTNNSFGQTFFNEPIGKSYEDSRLTYKEIKGSPYLTEQPSLGKLVLNDGAIINDVLLQIDLYKGFIIITRNDGEEFFLDKKQIWEVVLFDDEKNETLLKRMNPEKPDQFYIKLYEDDGLTFFKEKYVTIREGENHGLAQTEPKFNVREKHYIQHNGGSIEKVKLNTKEVFLGFSAEEVASFKDYAKSNKLKLKKEESFIELFKALRQ